MADLLVLDTNAFNARGFSHFLPAYRGRKVLPAVAAAELCVHHGGAGTGTPEAFLAYLRGMGVVIEPLDAERALLAVERPVVPEEPAAARPRGRGPGVDGGGPRWAHMLPPGFEPEAPA